MKPDLLVLAAGMGSRFGGLKQMEPIGPTDEWLLDYSVHDALAAGFGRVVFVIRQEMAEVFRPMVEAKYGQRIEIAYAYQDIGDTPIDCPTDRTKPWGTGHAVYAARNAIAAPFAVINADDFYGAAAFQALGAFLSSTSANASPAECALVGFELANTLSAHGSVSRGVCRIASDNSLISVEEHFEIEAGPHGAITARDGAGKTVSLAPETPVSLNFWGFPKNFAQSLEPLFSDFLHLRGHEPKSEFHLPAVVDTLVSRKQAHVTALASSGRWLGVTHRDDLASTRSEIAQLVAQGDYASPLWG